ncbi:uncharacterized protein [Heterodontus francisci]|uniref:uncharacterized protein isoform X2 n=1 Tax=Heterodontus francisci TaxID=7792 RepID=UPI00355BA1F8
MDTGRYLCAVHVLVSGKPVWKISTNISLTVTEPSAESSDIPTSTSGISSVTSTVAHTNTEIQVTSVFRSGESSDIPTSTSAISSVTSRVNSKSHNIGLPVQVAIVCAVVLICIVGVICIIRRKQQMVKGLPYSVVPRRDQTDEKEYVAYSVTRVSTPMSQPRPGEGLEGTGPISASTEHVYCLIEEPEVKGDGDKTEIQGVKCKDHMDHGIYEATELELNGQSQFKEEDPGALYTDQTYSVIGCPGSENPGEAVTQSHLEENDPKHCPLEMEENPIYAKMEDT